MRLTPTGINRLFLTFSRFSTLDQVRSAKLIVDGNTGVELTELGYYRVYQNMLLPESSVPQQLCGTATAAIVALHEALCASPRFVEFLVGNYTALSKEGIVQIVQHTPAPVTECKASSGATFMVLAEGVAPRHSGTIAVAYVGEPDEAGNPTTSTTAQWFEGTIPYAVSGPRFLVNYPGRHGRLPERCVVDLNADEVVVDPAGVSFLKNHPSSIVIAEETIGVTPGRRRLLYSNQDAPLDTFISDYDSVATRMGLRPLSCRPVNTIPLRQYVDLVL